MTNVLTRPKGRYVDDNMRKSLLLLCGPEEFRGIQ